MNPMRRGGSPTGVRQPPMFDTRKIKKIIMWALLLRQEFILITGRTISMLAPVVPIKLASTVPMASKTTFTRGDPARSPSKEILPEAQYRPKSRTIKLI